MNFDLTQRLLFAESDFLAALEGDAQTLASYNQTWSTLPDVLHTASKTGSVNNETLSLAHFVATRIAILASCFLDIRHEEEYSTTALQSDCDAMIQRMAALDLNANPKRTHQADRSHIPYLSSSTPTPHAESLSTPFFASAYQWLLDNLHNPYPTAEVKARIAAGSTCQISSINSWFINARRRIGWTTLCRERFSNCRADMLDAAYRALVEEDPHRMLSPEVRHSFVAMKVAAEDIYPSTFARSAFAGDLDAIVQDITKTDEEIVNAGERHQVKQANVAKSVRNSYPSPDRSIAESPVPALDDSVMDESEEEEDVAPPIIAGSKRRRSSMEPINQLSSTARRPMKRMRASVSPLTYLPSPPSSTDGIDGPSDDSSPEPSSVRSIRSDADSSGIPTYPCNLMDVPHLQPVSDPLPQFNMENESSIDDWFHSNFDTLFAIPPPVDAAEPDSSASWEVELFRDYNIPRSPKYAPTFPAQTADDHTPAVTNLSSDFDSLLQSIGNIFPTTLESLPPSMVPYTASLDSSTPDMSQTDIDWASLLNGPDTYQSTIHSTSPQYPTDAQPLPEIDLSILQLPQAIPPVNSQGDFAAKQAKLHQLHAMQEAVRRMEQELQSEGVVI